MDYTDALSLMSYPLSVAMPTVLEWLRYKGVPEILSLAILAMMLYVLIRGLHKWHPLVRQLHNCTKTLRNLPNDGITEEQYQYIQSTIFKKNLTLLASWNMFSKTLVENDKHQLFLTVNPAAFFSAEHFEGVVQLRRLAKWSGLFVGIGLLFTFLGLVAALGSASQAIKAATENGGQDTAAMQDALKALLSAATFKFYTSIFGLLASLIVSYSEKLFRQGLDNALRKFRQQLERLFPIKVSEQILYDQLHESKETTTQIKRFNTEISEGLIRMSGAVSAAMREAIAPVHLELQHGLPATSDGFSKAIISAVDPVRIGLDKVGQNLGSMEETFSRTLSEGIKAMQEETLAALANRLNHVVDQQAGAELNTMAKTLETLSQSLFQMKESLDAGGGAFAATLETAARELREGVAGLAQATRGISQNLAQDVSQTQTALQDRLRGIGEEMAQALNLMRESMTEAAGSVTGQGAQAVSQLGQAVENMVEAMRRTATESGEQTARNAQAMNESLASILREMRDETTRVAQVNQQAMERLLHVSTTVHENLSTSLSKVGEDVSAQGQAAAAQLTEGTTRVLHSLNDSLQGMGTHVKTLTASLAEVDLALGGHGHSVREATKGSQAAAKALETAAGNISAAATPVVATQQALAASVRGMEQSLRNLIDGASAVGKTASIAEASIRQVSSSLELSWQQHVGRFQKVDETLANVFQKIMYAMDSNAEKLNHYVQSIDKHLGKAVRQFSESVSDLNEVFEETLKNTKSSD